MLQFPSDVAEVSIAKTPRGYHIVKTPGFEIDAQTDLVRSSVSGEPPTVFAPHDGEKRENAEWSL